MRRALPWIAPFLAGFALFLLLPIGMSLVYALSDYALIEPPVHVGLANFRRMLDDPLVRVSVRNTLLYAAGSVALTTAASVALAVLLEQRVPGRGVVRAVVFVPTLIPVVAASLAWGWIYNPRGGLLNSALRGVGIEGPDWLGDPAWALGSLVFMSVWTVGTPMVVCTAALREIPASLREAAMLDGLSAPQRFRHITLPMISPAVLFNAVVSLVWSLQVFAQPQIMTRGGPDNATLVYSLYVFRCAFEYGEMGYASALAWVQCVATFALTLAVVAAARRFVHYRGA